MPESMIPKIIHYCWFGRNPLPPLALHCIESWKKFLPDYEIKEWNEDNFDVHMIPYTSEAYSVKKYAFVSDYARFWILNKYGGIYFDTDVEVIKPMEDILTKGSFMGMERNFLGYVNALVNPGVGFALPQNHPFLNEIIGIYQQLKFIKEDGTYNTEKTIVYYTTKILSEHGMKKSNSIQCVYGIKIYPSEYFSPIDYVTNRLHITSNTYTIHQFMGSWAIKKSGLKRIIRNSIPECCLRWYNRFMVVVLKKSMCPSDVDNIFK